MPALDPLARERDVDPIVPQPLLQLGRAQLRLARVEGGLERLAYLVQHLASRAALLRWQRSQLAKRLDKRRPAPEQRDPHLLEGGRVGRGGNRREPLLLDGLRIHERTSVPTAACTLSP